MLETAPFKGVGGRDSLRRGLEEGRGGAPWGLEPRRRRLDWLRVNRHKEDKKSMRMGRQMDFVVKRHVANSGVGAALKAQLVAFGGAGDSWLIGIADTCKEAPFLHF